LETRLPFRPNDDPESFGPPWKRLGRGKTGRWGHLPDDSMARGPGLYNKKVFPSPASRRFLAPWRELRAGFDLGGMEIRPAVVRVAGSPRQSRVFSGRNSLVHETPFRSGRWGKSKKCPEPALPSSWLIVGDLFRCRWRSSPGRRSSQLFGPSKRQPPLPPGPKTPACRPAVRRKRSLWLMPLGGFAAGGFPVRPGKTGSENGPRSRTPLGPGAHFPLGRRSHEPAEIPQCPGQPAPLPSCLSANKLWVRESGGPTGGRRFVHRGNGAGFGGSRRGPSPVSPAVGGASSEPRPVVAPSATSVVW